MHIQLLNSYSIITNTSQFSIKQYLIKRSAMQDVRNVMRATKITKTSKVFASEDTVVEYVERSDRSALKGKSFLHGSYVQSNAQMEQEIESLESLIC